ncbi:hypothetical protein, partial [Sedimentibacter sp. B4]|uniref:hypothetical protein n=1 Tax=Sedimentibacter sp. B4 TaxID=304766 RepID=UPI0018DE6668
HESPLKKPGGSAATAVVISSIVKRPTTIRFRTAKLRWNLDILLDILCQTRWVIEGDRQIKAAKYDPGIPEDALRLHFPRVILEVGREGSVSVPR